MGFIKNLRLSLGILLPEEEYAIVKIKGSSFTIVEERFCCERNREALCAKLKGLRMEYGPRYRLVSTVRKPGYVKRKYVRDTRKHRF